MLDQLLDQRLSDTRTPAIGYIRVSLAREEMISPELQRTSIEDWARRTNHRIVEWVIDLDKTGRNFKRRIMQAIERIERGEARVIAVWKYSRFGRNRAGIELNLARIEKVGGQLESATEQVDARTAVGKFQRSMLFDVAEFESNRAGEQWKETQRWRLEHGLPATGRGRFGYTWHPRVVHQADGTVKVQEERYEPDPALIDTVQELYRRYASGVGFRPLVAWLNEIGMRSVYGKLWSETALTSYMDSGFAAGYLRSHDPTCDRMPHSDRCRNTILTKHPTLHHPAIITEEDWDRYQRRRRQVRSLPPRARKAAYPLTGLIRCGLCGTASKRKLAAKNYYYYVCNDRQTKGKLACSGTSLAIQAVEAAVLDWLRDVVAELIDTQASEHTVRSPVLDENERREKKLAELREADRLADRAIVKHMKVHASSDEDDPDGVLEAAYRATLNELREEKRVAAQLLKAAEEQAEDPMVPAERRRLTAIPVAVGVLAEWESLSPEQLNCLLREVIAQVRVHPGRRVEVVPVWASDQLVL